MEFSDQTLSTLPHDIQEIFTPVEHLEMSEAKMFEDEHSSRKRELSSESTASTCSSEDARKIAERERNRQHARNARARKKAYTDELVSRLENLKQVQEAERKETEALEEERRRQRRFWQETLKKVMDLRAEGCVEEGPWKELLADEFKLTLPITPYRSYSPADVVNNRRVMLGVEGMVNDTASLKVMVDNIGRKTRKMEGSAHVKYLLGTDEGENCFFGNHGLACSFMMRTVDARAYGAQCECEKSGMLRTSFTSEGLMDELELTFDGISMYHQLKRAAGVEDFPLVPNTLQSVLSDQSHHIVVTTAKRPFTITHVNQAWTQLCGFELSECKGRSLDILQGPETDMNCVKELCKLTAKGFAASMIVTNYNKQREPFRNHLKCYPVTSGCDGEVTHMVGVLDKISAC
jgi:PAS domain-containing protein